MEDIYQDILFELGGVVGYFRDVFQDHMKWIPRPNLQISVCSIFTIFATFFVNVFHLRLNTLLSSNRRSKKNSLWLTVPLLIIIGGCVGIMWNAHTVGTMKPGRIDKAIHNVKLISVQVEKEIAKIDVENWEWEKERTFWLELEAGIDGISVPLDKSSLDIIAQQDEALVSVVNDIAAKMIVYQKSLQELALVYGQCDMSGTLNATNFGDWFSTTTSERMKLTKFAKNLENSTSSLRISLKDVVKAQGKVDIGKMFLRKRLEIMKNMLTSLRGDLTRLNARKDELYRNELESLPMVKYSLMIKTTVDLACSSLIILASVSILSIVWNGGTVSSADRMDDCVDMTTFITVISGIVLILCAQGYFGADSCTLSSSFGFRELTSPFMHENVSMDVCSKRESTFFGSLKRDPLLPKKPSWNLPIREEKHKLFGILNAWNVEARESSRFGGGLQRMEHLYGKLAALEKSNCSLLKSDQQNSIKGHLSDIKQIIDGTSIIKTLGGGVVEEMGFKTRNISDFIQRKHEEMSISLDQAVDKLTKQILSADSSCQPIVDNFARVRHVVCFVIENELENFKHTIFLFLAGCFVSVIIQMSVLRLYAYWFVDFDEDDDDSEDEY